MQPTWTTTSAPGGSLRHGDLAFGHAIGAASNEPPLDPGDDAAPGTPGTGENLCPRCNGSGRDGQAECPECGGTGKVTSGIGGG